MTELKKGLVTGLAVFSLFLALSGCNNSVLDNLPSNSDEFIPEIGKGTPLYAFLDAGYNQAPDSGPDSGKTAFTVTGNPLAEAIEVVAETSLEGYDDVIYIYNSEIYLNISPGRHFRSF